MSEQYQPTEKITLMVHTKDLAAIAQRAADKRMSIDAYVATMLQGDSHGRLVEVSQRAIAVLEAITMTFQNAAMRGELKELPIGAIFDIQSTVADLTRLVGQGDDSLRRRWYPSSVPS